MAKVKQALEGFCFLSVNRFDFYLDLILNVLIETENTVSVHGYSWSRASGSFTVDISDCLPVWLEFIFSCIAYVL